MPDKLHAMQVACVHESTQYLLLPLSPPSLYLYCVAHSGGRLDDQLIGFMASQAASRVPTGLTLLTQIHPPAFQL
jgi:hypothetical protein